MKKVLTKKIVLILILSAVISIAMFLTECVFTESNPVVTRNSYGKGKKQMEYEVTVEGEEKRSLEIEAKEQEYTSEEIQHVFGEVSEKLDELILGENDSFDRIEKDLNLVTEIEDYPVQIQWQMDSYTVLNIYGEIQEEKLEEAGTMVELRGTISYQDERAIYVKHVRVFPLTRTGMDKVFYEISQEVKKLEEITRKEQSFTLPDTVHGKKLTWKQKEENRWYYAIVLGAAFSAYLFYKEREREKEKIKNRQKEMLREYPGLVNKLTMLLGTGTTLRNAWEKIVQNYEKQKHESGVAVVYEEMSVALREMQGGIPEAEAYERFGKRCNIATYRKFGTLLSQNMRKGSKGVSDILKMEAIQSFENRKSTAKRLGEEASTKLLMPMLGMLAVVFVIVMVPAFLSMQS